LAKEKYSRLSKQLGKYGLETGNLDSDQYRPLRQTYRDGLSVITRKSMDLQTPIEDIMNQANNIPAPLLRLMSEQPTASIDVTRRFSHLAVASTNLHAQPKLVGGLLPGHPLLNSTRYTRDFEEFGILGKGGYGTVFRCKHLLDGRHYAIKKIPLGASRMRKIQQNGQAELDHILLEVRTLARLEHPNIVRYHSGWIEWAPLISPALGRRKLLRAPTDSEDDYTEHVGGRSSDIPAIDVEFGYDDEPFEMSTGQPRPIQQERFVTQEEEHVFVEEDSTRRSDLVASSSDTHSLQPGSYSDGGPLQKLSSRGTIASVSDASEIEVITRRDDPTIDSNGSSSSYEPTSLSDNHQASSSEPLLALHIQMSLYTMTLSDFLAPNAAAPTNTTIINNDNDMSSLRHCFHPHSSLEILSSIIDGVEYLHSEGIVHRDLKPGNIFLAIRPGGVKCAHGTIPLDSCKQCLFLQHSSSSSSSSACTNRPYNISIHIGDFGLVSSIVDDKTNTTATATTKTNVGTEIYRPCHVTRPNDPSLDVYSLGIIAYELLHRFDTRMERHEILHALKSTGTVSLPLARAAGGGGGGGGLDSLQAWIQSMVLACEEQGQCPGWHDLRAQLQKMLAGM
jgi:translation initiation factor 2-alpha kinase 3